MGLRITQVDSFTNRPFAGNPAGVCVLPKAANETWMLDVAREMNLAETAFLVPRNGEYELRFLMNALGMGPPRTRAAATPRKPRRRPRSKG